MSWGRRHDLGVHATAWMRGLRSANSTFVLRIAGLAFLAFLIGLYCVLDVVVVKDPGTSLVKTISEAAVTSAFHGGSANNLEDRGIPITAPPDPKGGKEVPNVNAAFVYLFAIKEESNFLESVRLLYKNFNARYNYPVLVYYDQEGVDPSALQAAIDISLSTLEPRLKKKPTISIAKVDFVMPPQLKGVNFTEFTKVYFGGQAGTIVGYNHMIRFWSRSIFERPEIASLDYYCRLDTDSFILTPVKFDFFRVFKDKGIKYGFNHVFYDAVYVTRGLWDFVDQYLTSHPELRRQAALNDYQVPAPSMRALVKHRAFYTNLEVAHIPSFLDPRMLDFVQALDDSLGIYEYRWGDAPVRYIQAMLFLDAQRDLGIMCAFDYLHQHHDKLIEKSC